MVRIHSCIAALPVLLGAAGAFGQHGGDVLLDLSPKNAIRTNIVAKPGAEPHANRVFEGEFGEVEPNFTDEPGFDSDPGAFPAPGSIGFTIRRALRVWNGVDFSVIPEERIEVAFASLGPIVTPPGDSPVTGFTLPVGSNGQWHRHLEYTITAPDGSVTPGIYLLELELFSTRAEVGTSLPFWLVLNQESSEEAHEAAVEWAHANLEAPLCRADWNADAAVNSQDFFDFLSAFFQDAADFNADGVTNSQDLFDFLPVFFTGC